MHLAMQERIWIPLASASSSLTDIIVAELLHIATDAGLGSEKAECVGNIMVSISSTSVRGRVIARLRKVSDSGNLAEWQIIAQTYLRPTASLADSNAWSEISVLTRIVLLLCFNPATTIELQLFLPEICHLICILLGTGPLLMRQTVYGLFINVLQALSSSAPSGEMEGGALDELLKRAQTNEMIACFGLRADPGSFELYSAPNPPNEVDGSLRLLSHVELVAKLMGEVLAAASVSIGGC